MSFRTALTSLFAKGGDGGATEPAGTSSLSSTVFFGQDWFNRGYDAPGFRDSLLSFSGVSACVDIISQDIATLPLRLWKVKADGKGRELVTNHPIINTFERPNYYQNKVQFMVQILVSMLYRGNAYIYVERNGRNEPTAFYPLMPDRVAAWVAPDASVFYGIGRDIMHPDLESAIVPQRYIMHPRMKTLVHPLIGVSPLYAAAFSAMAGLQMLKQTGNFFKKMARPSGILKTPNILKQEIVDRLRTQWDEFYGGENTGRVAVLEQALEWQPLTMSAVDAQMVQQLDWTVRDVARAFRVPAFLIGEMDKLTYRNSETLQRHYYNSCLRFYIGMLEAVFNDYFKLADSNMKLEFDVDQLLRMEADLRFAQYKEAILGGVMAPNEARAKEGMNPMPGGDRLFMQAQMVPLEQIGKTPPIVPNTPGALPAPGAPKPAPDGEPDGGKPGGSTDDDPQQQPESFSTAVTRHLKHELYLRSGAK